jgi:hypothetical protein
MPKSIKKTRSKKKLLEQALKKYYLSIYHPTHAESKAWLNARTLKPNECNYMNKIDTEYYLSLLRNGQANKTIIRKLQNLYHFATPANQSKIKNALNSQFNLQELFERLQIQTTCNISNQFQNLRML